MKGHKSLSLHYVGNICLRTVYTQHANPLSLLKPFQSLLFTFFRNMLNGYLAEIYCRSDQFAVEMKFSTAGNCGES